ncbi:MAG: DNA-directed RNA polymerase subunit omega [Acidobacteria bacterium]|nr:DNA-directed RNA polymerase subunit omega [Acidobacteriota bacterium]
MPETKGSANQLDSKYRKILLAAKRSKQIQNGARPRVHLPNSKSTRVALAEIDRGLINFEITND